MGLGSDVWNSVVLGKCQLVGFISSLRYQQFDNKCPMKMSELVNSSMFSSSKSGIALFWQSGSSNNKNTYVLL